MSLNITADLKSFKDLLYSSTENPEKKLEALQSIRKLLHHDRSPPTIDAVINQGVVPILVDFLTDFGNSTFQFEASWALANVATGNTEQTKTVINAGAIPHLISLLKMPVTMASKHAVSALANIAGDGPEARNLVLKCGVVSHLLRLLDENDLEISLYRKIVYLMANLLRSINKSKPSLHHEVNKILCALVEVLQKSNDNGILWDACWALSFVIDDNKEKIQDIIDLGCVDQLVNLLDCDDVKVVTAALRTVGYIVMSGDRATDDVLSANVLPHLAKLLLHTDHTIVREAAWTLSNITAGKLLWALQYLIIVFLDKT